MAYTKEVLEKIECLRSKLKNFSAEDQLHLSNELKSLNLGNPQNYHPGLTVWSPRDKIHELLNIIIEQGEPTGRRFLIHLEKIIPRFPALTDLSNAKRKAFCEIMAQLEMENYETSMITLREMLTIGEENLEPITLQTVQHTPWFFLRMLMSLNVNARNTVHNQFEPDFGISFGLETDNDHPSSIHPLDLLCIIMHHSCNFLQQEIVSKMAMCQFAVPLLLPDCDGPGSTFMLWAMRDIVKRWRPHSLKDKREFKEDNVVNIGMPVFSFVRLGKCSLSKSAILNQINSPSQRLHHCFIHRDMEGGNVPRKISHGLVEISWNFPTGQVNSDSFSDPIMVANLRGDISSNRTEFSFLRDISTAVFIFVDSIGEKDYQLLSNMGEPYTKYYFIVSGSSSLINETQEYLRMLYQDLKIDDQHLFLKRATVNDALLVKKLQLVMKDLIGEVQKVPKLEDMVDKACKHGIYIDENSETCQSAKFQAQKITENIVDAWKYKQDTMVLQGDLCKKLAETDKELYRMKKQGNEDLEKYRAKLIKQKNDLLTQHSNHSLPDDIGQFIELLIKLNPLEKHYFLKWMKVLLNSISMTHLSELQDRKPMKHSDESLCLDIKHLEIQRQSTCSLGVEHFIRELVQFYEAECFLRKEKKIKASERKFLHLPGVAADLLLDGFPLELIDGDASCLPLHWVTDVLSELDEKTGGKCTLRVVTVLGVQSTGKSTLLNTMFGLQFPVASGRCTRGAFMTLLNVKENFQEELGCHFILVIDTEGLKAPELASLEGSYHHDNELATLVVGLSDITIINMSMENAVEINDILQIVIHAFLRMNLFGRKPNCRFVHQNVSDVSAQEKNLRGRQKIRKLLDEMTQIAATMEKRQKVMSFADVLDHDLENNSSYIPSLWCGDPPMAPINSGYSENIYELKRNLLRFIKQLPTASQTIFEFSQWLRHLWESVQNETFIFSFINSLVASAYNQMSETSSELQWKFSKVMYCWMVETENVIRNHKGILQTDACYKFKDDLLDLLQTEETSTRESLEKYFESRSTNVNLIERYKEEFLRSVTFLRNRYENLLLSKLELAIQMQKGKNELEAMLDKCLEIIEDKASKLIEHYREAKITPSNQAMEIEFTRMWEEAFTGLQMVELDKRDIKQELLRHLQKELGNKPGWVTEKLLKTQNLDEYEHMNFAVDLGYFDASWYKESFDLRDNSLHLKLTSFVNWLLDKCLGYVREKVNLRKDYHETYCQDLLDMVNKELTQGDFKHLNTTTLLEMDLKLLILGKAAPLFQTMHEYYVQENDPKLHLERLKPQYLSTFQNIFHAKDECQNRAKKFCNTCLKPAITKYIYENLGKEMVDDILLSGDSRKYSSRKFFQFDLLKKLLEDNNFQQYTQYIIEYERFVREWISNYIKHKYRTGQDLKELHTKILSSITAKVVNVLRDPQVLESSDFLLFIEKFSNKLKKELVVPYSMAKAIIYQNTTSVRQFSSDVQKFLPKTEEELNGEFSSLKIKDILSKLELKPEEELFKKVFGCGKQCPFCRVPCEAGGIDHQEHFSSIHCPQGLGGCKDHRTRKLEDVICTTDVLGIREFRTLQTNKEFVPYREYRTCYHDWSIQPDRSINTSDYWKYVFKEFNEQFADFYRTKPADIPEEWLNITKEQAMKSLEETFNIK